MPIVRVSAKDLESDPGDVDWAKIAATTEEDIQRHIQEDGGEEFTDLSQARHYVPPGYVRAVRRRAGLTRSEFAHRFGLDEALLEQWESGKVEPDRTAETLLQVIDAEPAVVERVLHVPDEEPDPRA